MTVPAVGDGSDRESCWAGTVDVAAGRYRIDNVLFFTDGVSLGDVVRCEPNAWHHLTAVEILERSPYATLLFWRCEDAPFRTEDVHRDALRAMLDAIGERLGDDTPRSGGSGMFNVAVRPEVVDALLDVVTATDGGRRDDERRHAGEWVWDVVTSPDRPTSVALPGAAALLAEPGPELVAVDWPRPEDGLAASWPESLVEELRDIAAYDQRVRSALDDRRYLPVVAMVMRRQLTHELCAGPVGPQPFPLFPSSDPDSRAADRARWRRSRVDGRTRWAAHDDADARVRDELERLSLDPDADPYRPAD